MKFHVLTLFPEMILQGLNTSILGRAMEAGHLSLEAVNIRDYTENKHNRVDDYPYGGGAGMLLQAQPVYDAWRAVQDGAVKTEAKAGTGRVRTVYLTPQGRTFDQEMARELAREEELIFLCGHYEGIDERVLEEVVTDYVSIGDYVLTGGELPAMVMIDAIARLVPGVLNNDMSAETESFHGDLLEYPQYSRPEVWQGKKVPQVLLGGDHKKIRQWRLEQSIERTRQRRPDLYAKFERTQSCIQRLKKEKLLHIDMLALLERGRAEVLYHGPEGMLLRDKDSGICMVTSFGEEGAQKMVHLVGPLLTESFFLVSHRADLTCRLEGTYGLKVLDSCYQAVYTRKEAMPRVHTPAVIRQLGPKHLDQVAAHYQGIGDDYLRERLNRGCLWGAFLEDRLAGFVGIHEEGSIGMLTVLPEYRRQGIASALETYMVNLHLEKGLIPYGQIREENAVSLKLQEKLGLYLSREKICWMGKS